MASWLKPNVGSSVHLGTAAGIVLLIPLTGGPLSFCVRQVGGGGLAGNLLGFALPTRERSIHMRIQVVQSQSGPVAVVQSKAVLISDVHRLSISLPR